MAETGDAVKSVTSFPEDIRSCSILKIQFRSTKGCWVLSFSGKACAWAGIRRANPLMDPQVSLSPQHQYLAWFAAWRQQDRSSLSGKPPPCFLHCPSEKYDAHTGCSCFDTKSKEMLTQVREEMGRSLRRLICHMCKITVSKRPRRWHRH